MFFPAMPVMLTNGVVRILPCCFVNARFLMLIIELPPHRLHASGDRLWHAWATGPADSLRQS